MDNENAIWFELLLVGQRDLESMEKQEEKPSEALVQAAKREMALAANNLGITLGEFASIWKSDMTAQQPDQALQKLKAGKKAK